MTCGDTGLLLTWPIADNDELMFPLAPQCWHRLIVTHYEDELQFEQ